MTGAEARLMSDDKPPYRKCQGWVGCLSSMMVMLWLAVAGAHAAADEPGRSGSWDASLLPGKASPAWRKTSGTASESIENGRWVVRRPVDFCRRLGLGTHGQTQGQHNEVRFEWGTDCSDNSRADGLTIHTQGRRLRLHPLHRANKPDLLLVGVAGGMGPDRPDSVVDLSALDGFDARRVNRFTVGWVTDGNDDYRFTLTINGKRVGTLKGERRFDGKDVSLSFEFRSGNHTVDSVAWNVNRGGRRVVSPLAREASRRVALGYRQLFLDDIMVARSSGLSRVLHQPKKYARNPVVRHHQRPWQKFRAQLYGTVLYVPEQQLFKMWYLAGARFPDEAAISLEGRPRIPNFQMLAYAESRDGLNWTLPDLGLVSFNGSRHNNLCRFSRENAEGVAVVHDPRDPDPRRRYKAFYWEHSVRSPHNIPVAVDISAMSVSFSSDGKTWTNHPGNPVIGQASDTGHQTLWDPFRRMFVAYGRFGAGGRRIARSESRDFINWSPSRLVFATDARDGPGTQFYGMGTTIYEGVYVGLPWMFRENGTNRIDVQLATSRDGIRWQRVADRRTWIPNGPRGSWDGGCLFTASQPLQVKDDTVFIFYSALSFDHEQPRPNRREVPEYGESSIGVATLRRDGFVSMHAADATGILETQAFRWPKGRRLHVNVAATTGQVKVTVLDLQGNPVKGFQASSVVSGDQTDVAVTWPGQDGRAPSTEPIRLRFQIHNADFFSYWLK